MRNLIEMVSGNTGDGLLRGPLSRTPIRNTGKLGELEDALNLWAEGETKEAESHLLRLKDVARPFAHIDPSHTFYRGIILPGREVVRATKEGLTIRHRIKTLESWADDQNVCEEFLAGYDRPWIIMKTLGRNLAPLINLVDFHEEAHPFTQFHSQREVIVIAPPEQRFSVDDLIFPDMGELHSYMQEMGDDY